MAQKTGKEDAEFKVVPETIVICVTCGVSVNSVVSNLCQNCFNAGQTGAAGAVPMSHGFGEETSRSSSSAWSYPARSSNSTGTNGDLEKQAEAEVVALLTLPRKTVVNRCSGCPRKVGLTGFRCRCGELFCADHRYSDRHDCSYDYKAAGREAIDSENPVVKAAKIVRI